MWVLYRYQTAGSVIFNQVENMFKLDMVDPSVAIPPQRKSTTRQNLPICDPLLYIAIFNRPGVAGAVL